MNKSKKCTGLCWRCQLKEHGCVWPHTEMFAAQEALKIAEANTEYLVVPVAKILVSAVEKQIPMPPKVYKTCSATEIWPGHKEIIWDVWLECQKCGEKYTPYCGDEKVKYCPHCGQKLWWPKK